MLCVHTVVRHQQLPVSRFNAACLRAPANREGVIREEKYRQQKDRVMTTGDCMNKNIDPVFIQEIQRMDPCAAHTSQTLQPTRRPRRSTESTGVILIIFYREVLAKEG